MNTLLQKYIEQSLDQYLEPTRKGTLPGEKVGLSRRKFHTMLLCALTNTKQKNIAQEIGVSHGLLRKWRTEHEFLRYTGVYQSYFVETVKRHLCEKSHVHEVEPGKFVHEKTETNAYVKLMDGATLLKIVRHEYIFNLMEDASSYSQNVQNRLWEWADAIDDYWFKASVTTNFVITGLKGDELTERRLAKKMVDEMADLLSGKEQLTSEEISSTLQILHTVRRFL